MLATLPFSSSVGSMQSMRRSETRRSRQVVCCFWLFVSIVLRIEHGPEHRSTWAMALPGGIGLQASVVGLPAAPQTRCHLLVDGMNAIGVLYRDNRAYSPQAWAASMFTMHPMRLIGALQALLKLRPDLHGVSVVFDRPRSEGKAGEQRRKAWTRIARKIWECRGVQVHFVPAAMAGQPDGADRILLGLVSSWADKAVRPVVVTDDGALRVSLKRLGADCQHCKWLVSELKRNVSLVQKMEENPIVPQTLRNHLLR